MDQHGMLFNKIAPYYQWFFNYQVWHYGKIVDQNIHLIDHKNIDTILDIGCGTGAFGYVFKKQGYEVMGIDVAPEMVKRGKNNDLYCETGDISKGLKCKDNSYDMVISAMVAHGLTEDKRVNLYKEARRIADKIVLIQDYKFERNIFVDLIEKVEGGGYFNYIKTGESQINSIFENVVTRNVSRHLNWYISK